MCPTGDTLPFWAHGPIHRALRAGLPPPPSPLRGQQTSFTFLCPGDQHVMWKPEKVTLLSRATSPNTSKIVIAADIDLCYIYQRRMHRGLACVSSDEGPDHSEG